MQLMVTESYLKKINDSLEYQANLTGKRNLVILGLPRENNWNGLKENAMNAF